MKNWTEIDAKRNGASRKFTIYNSSDDGGVFMEIECGPCSFTTGNLTPEQAREIGRELMQRADRAEAIAAEIAELAA